MANHYTPAFKRAMKLVAAAQADGEDAAKRVFRDQMLKLGHDERVRNLYRISDKLTNKALFFRPNAPQLRFLRERSGRDIVLKCRQVGYTTLSAVRGLDYALWEPNSKCGILAHLQLTVTTIFQDLVRFTYRWFQRDWAHLYAPVEKAASRTELAFSDDGLGRSLDSSMRVLFDFRGKTINFLHVSEASRVEDERLLGSLQGVPINGQVIYESTPQGRAGDFYRQWQNWKSLGPQAPYKGFFVPWYAHYPEQPDDAKWKLPDGAQLTPYENSLLESDPAITTAHIAWRRWCVEANCQGDSDKFENEYPTNDIDCFFTGESLVFPLATLKAQSKYVRPPAKQGFLAQEGPSKIVFHDDAKGLLAIWDEPTAGTTYTIGADASSGTGKDRAAAFVRSQQNGKLVARLWGQLTPDEFAQELYKLATYYNKAWINPEVNNHGHVVVHVLRQRGYRNMYKRRVLDDISGDPTDRYGFQTTNETKLVLTEKFKSECKSGATIIQDNELLNEMSSFVQVSSKNGRGVRREAASGAHDDLVMAAALAVEMNSVRPISFLTDEPLAATPADGEAVEVDPITGFAS